MYRKFFKRFCDIVFSLPALLVFVLAFIFVAPAIFFTDRGPVFYVAVRRGRNGKTFRMIKFRSMRVNAPDVRNADGSTYTGADDPRVTKIGRLMRRTSVDELPQFINVLKGDMSIIGPRPMPEFFVERMSERHKMRHAVRPGLECPYTVPEGTLLNNYYWKFENDVWYVENISFRTDLKMIGRLFRLTFNMSNRGDHAGGLSYFVGYDDDGHAISLRQAKEMYTLEQES